ncbi:MAG: methyltransferase domain-containing protein [Roseinatronobacter sp.]
MSRTPPDFACPVTLARNRSGVRAGDDLFLHAIAAEELHLRLSEVNRTFTAPAIVTGLPQIWAGFLPNARVVADSPVLDLDPGAHDLVIHAMALHWAADPVGQVVQARRALKPDGLFLGVCFGGQTLTELRAALATAEIEVTGGLSPRVLPMAEIRDWGGVLQRAGLALPVADNLVQQVGYRDLRRLYADLRAMGERNALAARRRTPAPPALFRRTAQIYAAHHTDVHGHMRATFELIFLTGWAPDASQPQPLRPGSARTRLSDALGVPETPLSDSVKSRPLD